MGKRGRSRAQGSPASKPAATARPAARAGRQAPKGASRLGPTRRTLTGYVGAALGLSVATLLGIVVLGGTLGPFVTLAVVVVAAALIHRGATRRLTGAALTGEDRMMQTMAGGMLALCVVLAAAGAVLSLVA